MDNDQGIVSFLDLLDLDEELVDSRLKLLMIRSSHTNEHLTNAFQLLQYKLLINLQENTDCSNFEEFDFVVKLIKQIQPETAENVYKIVNTVLKLNSETLVSYSEHLLQQILPNIDVKSESSSDDVGNSVPSIALINLKLCDSVIDAIIERGGRISLLMLELPLEDILNSVDNKLKIHFITNTVPRLLEGIDGYNILDNIWDYVTKLNGDSIDTSLKILSCLSEFYLPNIDSKIKFESEIVKQYIFWDIIVRGLMSMDSSRKMSVYLAKRAIDYITNKNMDLNISNEVETLFKWNNKDAKILRNQWNDYFILFDSLEEKQSNIVLPSLQLFDRINKIEKCWLNCAFNLCLKHDNSQVRLKSIEHRLKIKIDSLLEAEVLLEALDDFNFYEDENTNSLKMKITKIITDEQILLLILKAIPAVHLTPVPLFHITDILASLNINFTVNNDKNTSDMLIELFKIPCNIIAMRKSVHMNILQFIGRHYRTLNWSVYITIASLLHVNLQIIKETNNAIVNLIKNELCLNNDDKNDFSDSISKTQTSIGLTFMYFEYHTKDISFLIDIMYAKVNHIKDIVNRQYSNKMDCYKEVVFLLRLFNYVRIDKESDISKIIKEIIEQEMKMIYQYMYNLLTCETILHLDEIIFLFEYFEYENEILNEIAIEIYKNSAILLKDESTELDKAILSLFFINTLSKNVIFKKKYRHEMLGLKEFLAIIKVFDNKVVNNAKNLGRSRNMCYEKHSETMYLLWNNFETDLLIDEIVDYVNTVIECGGYGCLKWILRIVNKIIDKILNRNLKFNIVQYINKIWREIEELKTNNQYAPCMREFVKFITCDALLEKPDYNNTIIMYCNKLIEYGYVKNSPLFYLVEELNLKSVIKHEHIVYVLCEILLHCPVPKKDQRIADNLTLEILGNPKYGLDNTKLDLHFNYEIQYMSILILSRISDNDILNVISSLIMAKVDYIFKSKVRYHGNSQIHRSLQTALQSLLLILLLKKNINTREMINWASELLGKFSHQISVRILLEWHISFYYYLEKQPLNANILKQLKSKNVSLQSQFVIIYWLLKRKIANNCYSKEEYEFVLDTLLGHTMGQMFNVRLLAQYLATKLYNNEKKYKYIIEVINRTLTDNCNDKNFMKLKADYFVNEFDIVNNLSTYFVYHLLPKLCNVGDNETVNTEFILNIAKVIDRNISTITGENNFKIEWSNCYNREEVYDSIEFGKTAEGKLMEDTESVGTIQKKYIPWKSMDDVNSYCIEKKRESPSDLIVVASLIDKLPNLGGMARTSEVFGVKTYVINSLRHLQDKQFQGLSVSAERWINIEEVRPGQTLKTYLTQKKSEGYSVVAAEQTSSSIKLQTFKFPKKTLLLLGHEKDGVPSDLLPMMDHCVEIPQQGYVRSLNVHVTAAIFVWEYARQNIL